MRSLLAAIAFCYRLAPPQRDAASARWIHWLVPLGLAGGAAGSWLVAVCWSRLWLMNIAVLWLAALPLMVLYWLGPGAARYVGWAQTMAELRLGRGNGVTSHLCEAPEGPFRQMARDPISPAVVVLLVLSVLAAAVVQYVAVATLPTAPRATGTLPAWLSQLLWPRRIYGGIVLTAVWGNGSILLAACLGRPGETASSAVRQLLATPLWVKLLWGLGGPVAVSALFMAGWRREGGWAEAIAQAVAGALAVAVILFGLMMLFDWLLLRRRRGHDRTTLLAAALLGELAVLLLLHAIIK